MDTFSSSLRTEILKKTLNDNLKSLKESLNKSAMSYVFANEEIKLIEMKLEMLNDPKKARELLERQATMAPRKRPRDVPHIDFSDTPSATSEK